MKLIKYKNKSYPQFQAEGFAAQFAFPFAKHFCKGKGIDVGCMKKEWAFPEAFPIDPLFTPEYDALKLPDGEFDYIFSSHMLEHLDDWVVCLDYWREKIVKNGWVFLYLPHYSSEYWRPWNNRKHKHILTNTILEDYFKDRDWKNILSSGVDLNASFYVTAQR